MTVARKRRQQSADTKRNWREDKADLYRRILVRMYADAKFQALSPLLPSGQALWLYLLTGPHTTLIPGLFSAGRAGLAEQLGWEQEDFDRCWSELEQQELVQAAWQARVVWVPNAIKHNAPSSTSVVISWRGQWPLIPECNLKWTAYRFIRNYLETEKGESFVSAFVSACSVPPLQAALQAAPQAALHPATHPPLQQEAGAGAGTGTGEGGTPYPRNPEPRRASGLAEIDRVWSTLGYAKDLANSGEALVVAQAALGAGAPSEHVAAALRAANWFVRAGHAKGLAFCWERLIEQTPLGGAFRWSGVEAPDDPDDDDPMPTSGKVTIADPLDGTPYTFAKKQHRIGRLR